MTGLMSIEVSMLQPRQRPLKAPDNSPTLDLSIDQIILDGGGRMI